MAAAELSLIIKAQNAASAVLKQVERDVGGLGKALGTGLKVGALAAAGGLVGAGFALKGFVGDAMESQKIMAQTNAVIASTKGAAGMSAAAVSDLAGELSKVIPIDDELIQKTENMLLTFTNIGKNVFPQATEAALDMATALGDDSVASAMRLGKALNDPIAGVSALRKVGVQLTDQQEAQIKVMMAAGDVAGAQKIILGELATEFGNSGRAAGETFAGKLAILKTQIGNVKESIGMALLPALTKLADLAVQYVVPAIEDGVQALTDFGKLISASLSGDVAKAAELFDRLPGPLQEIALWLAKNKEAIEAWVMAAAGIAKSVAIATFEGWKTILEALAPRLQEFGQFLIEHKPLLIALGIAIAGVVAVLIGWPALIFAVVVAAGYLTTKLQEWRKENEQLDTTLTGVGLTLQGLAAGLGLMSKAVEVATGFISDHKSVQIALGATLAFTLLPLTLAAAAFYAIGRAADVASAAFEKATGPMEWVRDRAYWIRDAFFAMRDAIAGAIDKLNIFGKIPGAGALGDVIGGIAGKFAVGGTVPGSGGWALMGERGPEIAWMPGGSRVYSNAESRQMVATPAPQLVQHIYITTYEAHGDAAAGFAALGAQF